MIEIGQKYGEWRVLKFAAPKPRSRNRQYLCECKCGQIKARTVWEIENFRQCWRCQRITHGLTAGGQTREYRSWASMLSRCRNPKDPGWNKYGGRGIMVCKRWFKFETFLKDMGARPANTSLDRINNNDGYSPSNCRWASRQTQMRNTRKNRLITAFGETRCVNEWAEIKGVNNRTLLARLNRGVGAEKALGLTS